MPLPIFHEKVENEAAQDAALTRRLQEPRPPLLGHVAGPSPHRTPHGVILRRENILRYRIRHEKGRVQPQPSITRQQGEADNVRKMGDGKSAGLKAVHNVARKADVLAVIIPSNDLEGMCSAVLANVGET